MKLLTRNCHYVWLKILVKRKLKPVIYPKDLWSQILYPRAFDFFIIISPKKELFLKRSRRVWRVLAFFRRVMWKETCHWSDVCYNIHRTMYIVVIWRSSSFFKYKLLFLNPEMERTEIFSSSMVNFCPVKVNWRLSKILKILTLSSVDLHWLKISNVQDYTWT